MTLVLNSPRGLLGAAKRKLWWVPNALTISRIAATILILLLFAWGWATALLPAGYKTLCFYLAAAAIATDLLDGWLARTCGWESATGRWLDPLADKITSIGIGVVVLFEYGFGWYLAPYSMAAYSLLWDGWRTSKLRFRGAIGGASMPAKIKTAVLMGSQLLFLADIAFGSSLSESAESSLYLAALFGFLLAAFLSKWSLKKYEEIADR